MWSCVQFIQDSHRQSKTVTTVTPELGVIIFTFIVLSLTIFTVKP